MALNAAPVMDRMLTALRHRGIRPTANSLDCDAAMIWSVLWRGRMAGNHAVYQHYRKQARPVIVIDIGTLNRGHTWKVAVNHVNGSGYYGHQTDLDPDRPRKLGVKIVQPPKVDPAVLIAAQHSASLQWQDQPPMEQWVASKIQEIRQHTDRAIVVRPHPRCGLKNMIMDATIKIQHPRKLSGTYDSFDLDTGYHAVVNHNSGPGIRAALTGRPAVVHESSLARPVSTNMADIDDPPSQDLHQWLIEICHTEYTLDELEKGLWLTRLSAAC